MLFNITKYSIKNILRNKFLSISTIIVLTLLMFFINVLQLLDNISVRLISEINSKMSISLYLKEWFTKNSLEVTTLQSNIKKINSSINFEYKTSEQNLLEMRQRDPEAVKILENSENKLPETIILSNIEIEDYEKLNNEIEKQLVILESNEKEKDYFANYTTQYNNIKQVTLVLETLKVWLQVIIIIFFVSIAIIIYSVIWNFVYYFKNEIYITRLVWGSKKFIYWPFILQWIIYSVLSFSISLFIFSFLLNNLSIVFERYSDFFKISLQNSLNFLLIFIIVWSLSWYFSSKKYLKWKQA